MPKLVQSCLRVVRRKYCSSDYFFWDGFSRKLQIPFCTKPLIIQSKSHILFKQTKCKSKQLSILCFHRYNSTKKWTLVYPTLMSKLRLLVQKLFNTPSSDAIY